MPFKTFWDYLAFSHEVTTVSRYRYDSDTEGFLKAVTDSASHRTLILPVGATLYRAQLHHEMASDGGFPVRVPAEPKRMKPEPASAKEGRVNPKGIPCLYLADKPETAMSEVRPWLDAYVSIGRFEIVRDLKLMGCTIPRDENFYLADPILADLEEQVWGEISYAFSEPVTDSDKKADYVPTQILGEVFKKMGCDGVKYRSLLGEGGESFALFNLDDAKLVSCGLRRVKRIHHPDFSDETQTYDITV